MGWRVEAFTWRSSRATRRGWRGRLPGWVGALSERGRWVGVYVRVGSCAAGAYMRRPWVVR